MEAKPSHIRFGFRAYCLSLLWVFSSALWGQVGIEVDGTVRDKDSNRKMAGVDVQVLRAGSAYDAVSTLSNGKYSLSLEHGADYELKFTFEDMSPRTVELNTSSIPAEFRERPFYLTVEMSVFDVPPGFDRDLLDLPIGKVSFDPSKEQLAWDLDYTAEIQARIEAELSDSNAAAEDADSGINEEYEEHMRKAEVEFGRERWEQSINWLERALTAVPGDARAENMLAEAQVKQEESEAAEAARRDYEVQMREGKLAMRKEDWAVARTAFTTASELIPSEAEPRELLAELDAMSSEVEDTVDEDYSAAIDAGTSALSNGDLDAAESAFNEASELKPSERLPREKLAEIRQLRKAEDREADAMERRRKEYEDLVERADRAFDEQDFVRAKSLYEQATGVLPDEVYPRTRAVEAAGRIVPLGGDIADSEPQADGGAEDEANREYEDRIREGDLAFDAEDWNSARSAYEVALELRPDERYPRNRLKRIESLTSGGEEGLDANLELDRTALLEEEASEAAASAAATAAMQEEQARMMEEERMAAEEEERRQASEAAARAEQGRDRSLNYLLALENADEDEAEAYYRDALQSEIRARAQAINDKMDAQEELESVWLSRSDTRRQSSFRSLTSREEQQTAALMSASDYRNDRLVDFEARTTVQGEFRRDGEAREKADRRDRMLSLNLKSEKQRKELQDRTRRYDVFVDSLDRMLDAYADFNRDLRRASIDARIMKYEEIERNAAQYAKLGEGEEIRRLERLRGVRKTAREDQQSKQLAAGEASIRSTTALRQVQSKKSGEPLSTEDYRDVPAKEGIREGIEERSYEEGNSLVIERTVRVDNEVNVFRKTVTKHGVYYFKNNHSITRDIWLLETFRVTD